MSDLEVQLTALFKARHLGMWSGARDQLRRQREEPERMAKEIAAESWDRTTFIPSAEHLRRQTDDHMVDQIVATNVRMYLPYLLKVREDWKARGPITDEQLDEVGWRMSEDPNFEGADYAEDEDPIVLVANDPDVSERTQVVAFETLVETHRARIRIARKKSDLGSS